ncbi:uncharacterized protein BCR38DRAFT_161879 [Pseudomassariella vexata]|uniref:Uncharacterized protein n=1 Tax=Pseudomassariella vexata TaxID=1141098 RepID=A0A1Y2E7Y4_9PEZI|nr:uncharacterized protein BCR38DRAFT_161879 [Pseudomassariella vexata]ORY67649.1 hypothetical protein BCR38DRAFT_161879 [Pseudomassariella vexata]
MFHVWVLAVAQECCMYLPKPVLTPQKPFLCLLCVTTNPRPCSRQRQSSRRNKCSCLLAQSQRDPPYNERLVKLARPRRRHFSGRDCVFGHIVANRGMDNMSRQGTLVSRHPPSLDSMQLSRNGGAVSTDPEFRHRSSPSKIANKSTTWHADSEREPR